MVDRVDTVENLRAFEVIQEKDGGHLNCGAGGGGGSGHGLDMERMVGGIENDTWTLAFQTGLDQVFSLQCL